MKIDDLEEMESEDLSTLPSVERRKFLKFGLAVTGMYLGGSVLCLSSAKMSMQRELFRRSGNILILHITVWF
jgi:hypothetical protein